MLLWESTSLPIYICAFEWGNSAGSFDVATREWSFTILQKHKLYDPDKWKLFALLKDSYDGH